MKKKTYIKPEIVVMEMEPQQMICTSSITETYYINDAQLYEEELR